MTLEERVAELITDQVEMSAELTEAAISAFDPLGAHPPGAEVPISDVVEFLLRKMSGLSKGLMLLAREMDLAGLGR